ncbi:hypothetical protein BDQ12DRAFT_383410 [Crucibulum laeve]|uniref:Uncharacterized protein n=1 Tax=Crucibulum laeve TaxID=68775 RepID=A0A5C3LPP5_9AGAR|nr:hypothetical protein BDQ12DRAFT_383410 [Crucibulum laeve]
MNSPAVMSRIASLLIFVIFVLFDAAAAASLSQVPYPFGIQRWPTQNKMVSVPMSWKEGIRMDEGTGVIAGGGENVRKLSRMRRQVADPNPSVTNTPSETSPVNQPTSPPAPTAIPETTDSPGAPTTNAPPPPASTASPTTQSPNPTGSVYPKYYRRKFPSHTLFFAQSLRVLHPLRKHPHLTRQP